MHPQYKVVLYLPFLVKSEFGNVGFSGEEKLEDLEKTPRRKGEHQQQTQPTCRHHDLNPGPILMIDKYSHHWATLVPLG